LLSFLTAGCRFSIAALDDVGPRGGETDLGVGGVGGNGGDPGPDLGAAPDLAPDPCAVPAPTHDAHHLGAGCAIGSAPTVDGDLSDWPQALFAPVAHATAADATGSWSGVSDTDSSARVAVRWDLQNVYVAVAVSDDRRETPSSTLTENDACELFFDGAHDRTASYGSDDWQMIYTADRQTAAYQGVDGLGNSIAVAWPTAAREAWRDGPDHATWTLEVAVPWSALGGTPSLGRVVGFDLKLDDNDSAYSTRDRALVLFDEAPGGGLCRAPYCRTDWFGAVQMMGR
jgi:hypothetical protein